MDLLTARTPAEAHLYMDLCPCSCGDRSLPHQSTTFRIGVDLVTRHAGTCPTCGSSREFLFRLPDGPAPSGEPPLPGVVVFGDGTPSQLLDPGEWLWVADRYAGSVDSGPTTSDWAGRSEARRRLAAAEAAVGEVLAFVSPDGDAVPPESFRTPRGRAMYTAEPGRFARDRLEAVRDTYRRYLDELDLPPST